MQYLHFPSYQGIGAPGRESDLERKVALRGESGCFDGLDGTHGEPRMAVYQAPEEWTEWVAW